MAMQAPVSDTGAVSPVEGVAAKVRVVHLLPCEGVTTNETTSLRESLDQLEEESQAALTSQPKGRPVISYRDFVEYLQRKPTRELPAQPRASKVSLPFLGKNAVVYSGH
eukprot:COSAG01_NODE_4398_length_5066_cov_52.758204_4_plen_109_part_00